MFITVYNVKKWHTSPPRNWRDIGYHYVIDNGYQFNNHTYDEDFNGLIEAGLSMNNDTELEWQEKGAHSGSFINKDSIGICLIGKKEFTNKQFESLIILCSFWERIIPGIEINGHYEFSKKDCPEFKIDYLKEIINNRELVNSSLSYLIDDESLPIKEDVYLI